MGWLAARRLAMLVVWAGAAVALHATAATDISQGGRVAVGERIYREGTLSSGRPLTGVAQVDIVRVGADAACAACHRRSGFGGSEGSLEIRPITGPALFGKRDGLPSEVRAPSPEAMAPSAHRPGRSEETAKALRDARVALLTGSRQLPSYDDASLRRAIREGVDVSGRKLNPAMPRFAIDDGELDALVAYLKTLSAQVAPGVADDAVHFATVIQPGVDTVKRRAMLDVMRSFIDDRNAQMRAEAQRHPAGSVRLGRRFREWRLHVWDLEGPGDSWSGQLELLYARQPVFALIGGLGRDSWRPIHEFSERFEVPCIFPQTDVPVVDAPGIYTVYLSRGIVLEAEALAKYLQEQGAVDPVVQVRRRDGTSAAAAEAFRNARRASTGTTPLEHVVDGPPTGGFWLRLANEARGSQLVLWLPPADLADLPRLADAFPQAGSIYLSAALLAGTQSQLTADPSGRVRVIYPQDLPQARSARVEVVRQWLRGKGLELVDETVQMNAFLAVVVAAGAMAHTMDTYSRDFLLERVEHRVGNALDPSLYPRLSLGPGQRYASKGSYIVTSGSIDGAALQRVSSWLVP
jgi:hypothetical protein